MICLVSAAWLYFGLYNVTEVKEILKEHLNFGANEPLSQNYNLLHCSRLKLKQIFTLNEIHCKVADGSYALPTSLKQQVMKFLQDKNEKLDQNGTYSNKGIQFIQCKYTDKVRISFGVVIVQLINADGNMLLTLYLFLQDPSMHFRLQLKIQQEVEWKPSKVGIVVYGL